MTKLQKLRVELKNRGVDALLVLDELNQHYLSDFAFTDGFLAVAQDEAYIVTDFRYYEMALNSADKEFKVVMPDNRGEFLENFFSKNSVKTVGFEGGSLSYAAYRSYCDRHKNVEFVDIGKITEELRQLKTPDEIRKMQLAQDIADKAYAHVINLMTPNMTEIEVAVELEYAMRKAGAEAPAFDTIAVSGDASSLPHGTPRNIKLKPGFLTMDFGAKIDGYCSDMTRTVVIGKADAEIKKLYNTVLEAQLAALDFLHEGVDAGEADKVARDIIDSHPEYKGAFGHSLGHSVGLFIHEAPSLSFRSFGRKLRSGEILTVEPGIYLFGKYGCRIEDMVLIEKNGVYNFTHSPKELIEIV